MLEALAARGQSARGDPGLPGVEGVDPWALDAERRALIQETEELRHRQRTVGEEIARRGKAKEDASALKAEMKGVADRIKRAEARLEEVEGRDRALPAGGAEPARRERAGRHGRGRQPVSCVAWASRRAFDFTPKAHWELGPELGILDFERAAKLSGARFAVCWARAPGSSARSSSSCSTCTRGRGYTEVIPPYLVTAETLTGTGQLPKFEGDLFKTRPATATST